MYIKEEKGDNIYEVIINMTIPKRKGEEAKSTIKDFLTDIRAITRVTIADSLASKTNPYTRDVQIKIKFNTKYFGQGENPQVFVKQTLIPQLKKLDANPIIKYVSYAQDHITKSQLKKSLDI
jgi:hypothetical protein